MPEGVFLATSDEVEGLVTQGRSITESLEIARDVAKTILELREEYYDEDRVRIPFDYPLVIEM